MKKSGSPGDRFFYSDRLCLFEKSLPNLLKNEPGMAAGKQFPLFLVLICVAPVIPGDL